MAPISFTPTRLQAAKAAVAATAVATTVAVSAGAVAPYAAETLRLQAAQEQASTAVRAVVADVNLAASVGVYTDGPLFQLLGLLGLGDPITALNTIIGLVPVPIIPGLVTNLITALEKFGPLESAQLMGSGGIYRSVNGLDYSTDALAHILGISPSNPLYALIKTASGPMINQRRAFLVTESIGGTDAALALRQMIDTVSVGDASWGGNPKNPGYVDPGVTAVVAVMFRNPSRPGGGLWNLINPLTSMFGVNLLNPSLERPAYGSTISLDHKQVLNVSFTDVALKYDILSDIPSTFNPVSWLNTLMGAILPTYLIPDKNYVLTAAASLAFQAAPAANDAIQTTLDPSGGQGLQLVPVLGNFLNILHQLAPGLVNPFLNLFKQPGNANYIMYNSGNLPLVEPLAVIPRLLSYAFGIDLPTPISDTLARILQPIVDSGYQDARLVYSSDGVPTVVRTADMGATAPDMLRSPFSAVEGLQMPQVIVNAALQAIEDDFLSPENMHLSVAGVDLSGIFNNALVIGVAHALRTVVNNIRVMLNPVLDTVETALEPLARAADTLTTTLDAQLRAAGGAQSPAASAVTRAGISPKAADTPAVAPPSVVRSLVGAPALASRPVLHPAAAAAAVRTAVSDTPASTPAPAPAASDSPDQGAAAVPAQMW